MNISKTLKTSALAVAVVLATAGASFAAQWAWVDYDAKVKKFHKNASPTVNWVQEGQKVKIIGSWGNWYKIKIPGPDGWVKAGALDWNYNDWDDYGGGHVCFNGQYGSLCIGN
ncbi:MAG: SH3 domain-containing protein [Devosia sp.]